MSFSTHYHFTVVGYQKMRGDTLIDSASIEVIAPDEETAVLRAKTIVKKNNYRISSARECHTAEPVTERIIN